MHRHGQLWSQGMYHACVLCVYLGSGICSHTAHSVSTLRCVFTCTHMLEDAKQLVTLHHLFGRIWDSCSSALPIFQGSPLPHLPASSNSFSCQLDSVASPWPSSLRESCQRLWPLSEATFVPFLLSRVPGRSSMQGREGLGRGSPDVCMGAALAGTPANPSQLSISGS